MLTKDIIGNFSRFFKGWGLDFLDPKIALECAQTIKDIVQPKKRGVKRGIIRFVLTSYTITDIF
jgi:hypothetical protein